MGRSIATAPGQPGSRAAIRGNSGNTRHAVPYIFSPLSLLISPTHHLLYVLFSCVSNLLGKFIQYKAGVIDPRKVTHTMNLSLALSDSVPFARLSRFHSLNALASTSNSPISPQSSRTTVTGIVQGNSRYSPFCLGRQLRPFLFFFPLRPAQNLTKTLMIRAALIRT
jgi:hypothetical protein